MNHQQRKFIAGLIVIGLIVMVVFGVRTLRAFRQFHGHRPAPALGDQRVETNADLIRDWMTLPYISITYRLPPDLLYEALEIPPAGNKKKSLKQLNDEYFPETPGLVLELVKAAVRANQPPPTAVLPDPPVPALTPVRPVVP